MCGFLCHLCRPGIGRTESSRDSALLLAGANYRERDEGEVILGGFELGDIPKIAASFNILVVFSYELEFKEN